MMRELIETIDLMETDLNRPLKFKETLPGTYFFSFTTPNGKVHVGEVALDEMSTKPYRGNQSEFQQTILTLIDSTEDVELGYLQYSIDDDFTGFDTQGYARQILSTVIAAAMDWLKKHPRIKYLTYTAAKNDGTNNRPSVYHALSHLMSKKYGFKAFSNNPKLNQTGTYVLQVRD